MLSLLLAAAAAALSPPPGSSPATPIDKKAWFKADDYPPEAAKKGVEGSARVEVAVGADGKPTSCRIAKSSGSALLDQKSCDIIMERATFTPGKVRGHPVPGQYQDNITWRLAGPAMPNGFWAMSFDLKDPEHPGCKLISGSMPGGPTCEQALRHYLPENVRGAVSAVALMTMTTGDKKPYPGDPKWGERVNFSAIDLFPPKTGAGKPYCVVVAQEGLGDDFNACAQYPDGSRLSDSERKGPNKMHLEESMFFVFDETAPPASGKCKSGETAAEASGCG